MTPSTRSKRLRAASLAASAALVSAAALAQQAFTPKTIVQWGQGGDRERNMLTQMGVGDLAQGQFGLSVADLNGDNRPEILVLSMGACDNTGCPVTAIQSAGGGKVNRIFSQRLGGRVAITNEQVNGFNAFAAADPQGAIMKDAAGKLLVYPVGGAPAAAPPAAAVRPAAPAPAAPQAAPAQRPAPAAAVAATPPPAPPKIPPERLKLVTGEGNPDWRTPGANYLPPCTFPKCLSPRITEVTGVGTAQAVVRAAVAPEDAAKWCAIYRPQDKLCAQDEVALGGSDGMFGGRDQVRTFRADCMKGTMSTIGTRVLNYAGTFEDGPGKGRARFSSTPTWEQQGAVQMNSGAWSLNEVAREQSSGEALAIRWETLCGNAKPGG